MSPNQTMGAKPCELEDNFKDDSHLWVTSPFPQIQPVFEVELHEFLLEKILSFGPLPALTCPVTGKCLTYEQVYQQARGFGAALIQSGVKKGDIGAIVLLSCVEYPVVLLGCWCAGMTVVTMNPRCTLSETTQQLQSCNIRLLITNTSSVDKIQRAKDESGSTFSIILVDEDAVVDSDRKSFAEMVTTNTHGVTFSSGKGTDTTSTITWLAFSSGTTGPPKLVMCSNAQLVLATKQFHFSMHSNNSHCREGPQQRCVAIFPFFHGGGLLLHILAGLYSGAHTVVMSRYVLANLLQIVRDHKPTLLHLPTPVVAHIVNSEEFTRTDMASIHTILSAGAPIGTVIINKLMAKAGHNIFFQECYGMTEVTPLTFLDSASNNRKIGSCGPCVPSVTVKIVDVKTGQTLGPRQPGEICAKGPVKPMGYFRNEKATRELIDEDGWVHTGDVAYYDEDGYFFVVDRIKELIKVKGFQVAPSELEDLLRKHPKVLDCAVIGIPSEEHGEVPRAIIVPKNKNVSEDDIQAYLNPLVATYKQLKGGVEIVETIPKTESGKILRRDLRQQYVKKREVGSQK